MSFLHFLQFKLSVLALGTLFILLLFALLLDAGELSFLSRNVKHYRFLKKEGFECKSKFHDYEYKNHTYPHRECYCTKGQIIGKCAKYVFSYTGRIKKKVIELWSALLVQYTQYLKESRPFE